ncbi:MAG: nucleotidyltransferase substrate binding protein [Candidatus Omnitrophica bacterium]|nr:nucleotidyltransferase substrate binding protein [Candidatus Omnitrophota bacterium]
MERLRQRLLVAHEALSSLQEILQKSSVSLVERDAAIQRFEYTVEAVWRAAQRHLEVVEGLSAGSPKAATRLCREAGLLDDDQATQALEMVDDRNLTVHTYNEQIAQRIYGNLPRYAALMEQWLKRMEARLEKGA